MRCQRCCLAPGAAQAVISRRKTIRAVIIRTIIDGTTDMRESPDWIVLSMMAGDGFRPGPLLPGFFGEPVAAWVVHLQCGNKADLVAPEIIISAVRQNFVKVSPDALMNRERGISATCCWGAEVGKRLPRRPRHTNWQMRARELTVASFARGNIHHTED